MYKNTFQTLKLPKCEKGPTTSHLLTASGRFKTSMATLQENFDIKTIQELKNGYCVQYAESSIVEIGEIMCLNLTQKQKRSIVAVCKLAFYSPYCRWALF